MGQPRFKEFLAALEAWSDKLERVIEEREKMPFTPQNEEALREISEALLWKLSGRAGKVTLHLDRDEALTLLAALEHKGVTVETKGVPA